jgi:hypothetical protein
MAIKTTKINTREQAEAAIRAVEAKAVTTHHDRVVADAIKASIGQVEQYWDWGKQIDGYDAHGDVVLRDQEHASREEWVDTRMSGLAKRLSGLEE